MTHEVDLHGDVAEILLDEDGDLGQGARARGAHQRRSGQSCIDQLAGLQSFGVCQTLRPVTGHDIGRRRAHVDQQQLRPPVGDQASAGEKISRGHRKRIRVCRLDGTEAFEAQEDADIAVQALARLLQNCDNAGLSALEYFRQLGGHRDGVDGCGAGQARRFVECRV